MGDFMKNKYVQKGLEILEFSKNVKVNEGII